MRLDDLVKSGTDEDLALNLIKIGKSLTSSGSCIKLKDQSDILSYCIRNLVQYSAEQLSRLAQMTTGPIEFQAWVARNLFEANLIIEYLIQKPNAAKNFISQKATDEIEIYEGMLSLKSDIPNSSKQPVLDRIEHIQSNLEKHSLEKTKPWRTSWLASATGNKDEYQAFFKLYSKYVHPSSWIVLGARNGIDTPIYRNLFLFQSQYYASRINKLACDYCESCNYN